MSDDWLWISRTTAIAIHREQIATHGGGDGVRDLELLENALARPRNLVGYADPDGAALAASTLMASRVTIRLSMETSERQQWSAKPFSTSIGSG